MKYLLNLLIGFIVGCCVSDSLKASKKGYYVKETKNCLDIYYKSNKNDYYIGKFPGKEV
jgi:hypothetical protein